MRIQTESDFKLTLGRKGAKNYEALERAAKRARQEAPAVDAYAYINHGRWVADCPHCTSARMVEPEQDEFLCLDDQCHRVSRLVWPAQRPEIERILLARPNAKNRNWYPHESLAQLRAENREHGHAEEAE